MAIGQPSRGLMVAHNMVTTQFELDGYKVVRTLGVVRGIIVRSRSIFGTIGASLQTIVGGNISLFTQLCEKTRADAFDLMLLHEQRRTIACDRIPLDVLRSILDELQCAKA